MRPYSVLVIVYPEVCHPRNGRLQGGFDTSANLSEKLPTWQRWPREGVGHVRKFKNHLPGKTIGFPHRYAQIRYESLPDIRTAARCCTSITKPAQRRRIQLNDMKYYVCPYIHINTPINSYDVRA